MLLIRSGIWLPRVLHSTRREPGDYVCDFLVRHWLAWDIAAPIGCTQFGSAGYDNRAHSLVANQCKERIVGDGTALRSTFAGRPMAGRAILPVSGFTLLCVAKGLRRVRRRVRSV